MAAAGIVTAVVAVAGTVASIDAQNRAASQQNAAISAQISSNERAEEIRAAQSEAQKAIIQQQHRIQKQGRQVAFRQEQQQLRQLDLQNRFQAQQQLRQLGIGEQANQLGLRRFQAETGNELESTRLAAQEDVTNAINQAASNLSGVSDSTQQVDRLVRDQRNLAAQTSGLGSGRGRTSELFKDLDSNVIQAVMQELQNRNSITAESAQAVINARETENLVNQLAEMQAGLNLAAAGDRSQFATDIGGIQSQLVRQQSNAAREQLRLSRRQNRLTNKLQRRQSVLNRDLSIASLLTGHQLGAAQSAAQNAQLQAQRVSGPGFLGSFAAISQSLAPLLGTLGTNNASLGVPIGTGVVSNAGLGATRASSTGVLTDVTGLSAGLA